MPKGRQKPWFVFFLFFLCLWPSGGAGAEEKNRGGEGLPAVVFSDLEDERLKKEILEKLGEYWKTLTGETRLAIRQVEFVSDRYAEENLGWDPQNDGEGLPGGYLVSRANERFHFRVFRHEAAHERHYAVRREEETRALKSKEAAEIRKLMVETPDRAGELQKRYMQALHHSPFEEAWQAIAGDVYGKVSFLNGDGFWMWKEFEGMTKEQVESAAAQKGKQHVYGPRHGCLRPYGCSSLLEDVATFVDKIDEPSFYAPLVDPKGVGRDDRYKRKLELFREYRFISDEEFRKIMEAARR